MDINEKLALLEEMLDLEPKTLNKDMRLDEVDNWDSVAFISFIALADEKFDRNITTVDIRNAKTVGDLLKLMERDV